ncbi:hypothetical protein TrRE_jg5576, partial [Triparma retinervis]
SATVSTFTIPVTVSRSQFTPAIFRALSVPVSVWNSYESEMCRLEVLAGVKGRLSPALMVPPRGEGGWERTAVVAVLRSEDGEVKASGEVRLQPPDGKIPFGMPLMDRVERGLGDRVGARRGGEGGTEARPYLCNLFTREGSRGKGLGRTVVRIMWFLATEAWGYDDCYLHVDKGNKVARRMYEEEGWREVDTKWMPGWEGRASGIGYYRRVKEE